MHTDRAGTSAPIASRAAIHRAGQQLEPEPLLTRLRIGRFLGRFFYILKARLRAAALARRQRHDGHGTRLTLSTRASQRSGEEAGWTTLGLTRRG
jgi:hypothetical protein